MKIIGAGMAGLIAGHMMRRHSPTILEAGESLPDNHSALLRFRSDAVSNATSIPFNLVQVQKGVMGEKGNLSNEASISDKNSYSQKATGSIQNRSIGDVSDCKRWVAPSNFVEQLSSFLPCSIEYGIHIDALSIHSKDKDEPWISTIPMPVMMSMVGWDCKSEFQSREITTITADICAPSVSVHQTVYLPYRHIWGDFYRASIHGCKVILEAAGKDATLFESPRGISSVIEFYSDLQIVKKALKDLFGITDLALSNVVRKTQKFGKILPIDDQERERFILYLTEKHNIYSLGRFATWRPILLDDVVRDVTVIDRLLEKSPYTRKKHQSN